MKLSFEMQPVFPVLLLPRNDDRSNRIQRYKKNTNDIVPEFEVVIIIATFVEKFYNKKNFFVDMCFFFFS